MASLQVITELANKIDSNPPHEYDEADVKALADEFLRFLAHEGNKRGLEADDLVDLAGKLDESGL